MAWIARSEGGYLYLYENKPSRICGSWISNNGWCSLLMGDFDSRLLGRKITWKDEPIEIEIKIKEDKL